MPSRTPSWREPPTTNRKLERYMDAVNTLELLDWKRRVAEMYAAVRKAVTPAPAWERWRRDRAELFADHPQSPRRGVEPKYFPYDPAGRAYAHVEPTEEQRFELPTSGDESMAFTRSRPSTSTSRTGRCS